MQTGSYNELVKKHFRFLVDDYGFTLVRDEYDPEAFGNSLVEYRLPTTIVMVSRDRDWIRVGVGSISDPRHRLYSLESLIEFFAPEAPKGIDTYQPEASDDFQLSNLACILQDYGGPVLRGEFTKWKELEEYVHKEVEEFMRQRREGTYP